MQTSVRNNTVVVVGYGWVGQANALALARMGYQVFFFDVVTPKFHYASEYASLYELIKPLSTLLERDLESTSYLVCIGDRVSEDGEQDIGFIMHALEQLKSARGKVILRSTVLPTYLPTLTFDYYFPEFLHEMYAVDECYSPFYFVLGIRSQADELPQFLDEWKSRARKVFVGTPEQASYIKYLSNIWNAVRIAFVNEFGDVIADPVDETRRKQIEQVLDFVLERKSYLKYGQGFGGHCLPKDMRAFMRMAELRMPVPLLRGVYAANIQHGLIQEKYKSLPQWFSSWDYRHYSLPVGALIRSWQRINSLPLIQKVRARMRPALFLFEQFLPVHSATDVKRHWERLAKKQPYYYAHPDTVAGKDADEFDIKKTGEKDFVRYLRDDLIFNGHLKNFSECTILDIGVGVGRMTECMANHFREVIGVDISPTMISIAKKRLSTFTNVKFYENSGTEIPVPAGSVDAVFSYEVFRHSPSVVWVNEYLKEMYRILKKGGVGKIHLRTGPAVHRWWWFYGVSVSREVVENMAKKIGFEILKSEVQGVKHLWLWLQK